MSIKSVRKWQKRTKDTVFMALVMNLALPFISDLVDVVARCSMCIY